jgi:hypothetical protein
MNATASATTNRIRCCLFAALALVCWVSAQTVPLPFTEDWSGGSTEAWRFYSIEPTSGGTAEWVIEDGALVQTSNIYTTRDEYDVYTGTMAVIGDSTWEDYTYSLTVNSEDDDGIGVVFRVQDSANYYRFLMVEDDNNGGPFRRIERCTDGAFTVLAVDSTDFAFGTDTIDITVTLDGSAITVQADTLSLQATDTEFTAGGVGLTCYANTGSRFDDIRVQETGTTNSLPFADDFEREQLGSAWSILDRAPASGSSEWAITDGVLGQASNIYTTENEYQVYTGTRAVTGGRDWEDYEFSVKVRCEDDDGVGLLFRYQDADNYYRFFMVEDDNNGGPLRKLEKCVDGAFTILAVDSSAFSYTTEPFVVTVRARGAALSAMVDGESVVEAEDDGYATGGIGLMCYANVDTWFDSVRVSGSSTGIAAARGGRPAPRPALNASMLPGRRLAVGVDRTLRGTVHVALYDGAGRVVKRLGGMGSAGRRVYDMSHVGAGVYLVRLEGRGCARSVPVLLTK